MTTQREARIRAYIKRCLDEARMPMAWRQARVAASPERRDVIDDAICWRLWRITGPALHRDTEYPNLDVAAAYVLGDMGEVMAQADGLRRRHAIRWAQQSRHSSPAEWLARELEVIEYTSGEDGISCAVLYWLKRMLDSPARREALFREVQVFGDHVEGQPIKRLDELKRVDLRDSVRDTFVASFARRVKEQWDGPDKLIDVAAGLVSCLPEGVEVITGFKNLFAEGLTMRHCVASYAHKISEGKVLIFGMACDGDRSTLAIDPSTGAVTQHCAKANAAPSERMRKLAKKVSEAVQEHLRRQKQ